MLFAAFAGLLAKKIANHSPTAGMFFAGVSMKFIQRVQPFLEFGSFKLQLIFLDEAAVDGKIVLVPEKQCGRLFAVPPVYKILDF